MVVITTLPALLLAEWVSPDLRIDGFWTYVGAIAALWAIDLLTTAATNRLVRWLKGRKR